MADSLNTALSHAQGDEHIEILLQLSSPSVTIDPVKRLTYSRSALEEAQSSGNEFFIADAYNKVGMALQDIEALPEAQDHYLQALTLFEKLDDKANTALVLTNLGKVMGDLRLYTEALPYIERGLELRLEIGNKKLIASSYVNISVIYNGMGKFPIALEYLRKASRAYKQAMDSLGYSRAINNIGVYYQQMGNLDSALVYFLEAYKLKINSNDKRDLSNTIQNIASIYLFQGDLERSKPLLDESMQFALETDSKRLIKDGYWLYSEYYKAAKDFKLAYENLQKASVLSDSLFNDRSANYVSNMAVKYESAQKEKENEKLRSKNEFLLTTAFIIGAFAVIIIALIVIRYRENRKHTKIIRANAEQLRLHADFIEFLGGLSSSFINLSANRIDTEIEKALESVSNYAHFDRSYIYLFRAEENCVELMYEYSRKGINPPRMLHRRISLDGKETYLRELAGSTVIYGNTASLAKPERNEIILELIKQQAASYMIIPLSMGDEFLGIIGFDTAEEEHRFGEQILHIFKLTGEMIGNALSRKQFDEKLQTYAEELEKANEMKDKFFSIIAHDLKSPMQTLIGYTEMLNVDFDEMTDAEKKENIITVYDHSKKLVKMIDGLLQWSRLESHRMPCNPEHFSLHEEAESVLNLIEKKAESKQITLRNDISKDAMIYADKTMLQSILQNLITNAIKFTPEGGSIFITGEQNDQQTEFSVRDTGIGISKQDMEKLFRLDVHHSTPGTAKEEGTGFGLLLCKEMIDLHNGTLTVASEQNKGTTFTVRIPAHIE